MHAIVEPYLYNSGHQYLRQSFATRKSMILRQPIELLVWPRSQTPSKLRNAHLTRRTTPSALRFGNHPAAGELNELPARITLHCVRPLVSRKSNLCRSGPFLLCDICVLHTPCGMITLSRSHGASGCTAENRSGYVAENTKSGQAAADESR